MSKKTTLSILSVFTLLYSCQKNSDNSVKEYIPLPPTNLIATAVSASEVELSWTDKSTNEKGFKIERKTGNGTFSEIGTTATDVTKYIDKGVSHSTTYVYRLMSYNSAGNSATYSNELTVNTSSIPAIITTNSITSILINSANSGGNITDDGGSSISQRGVVWSTFPNPTISLTTKTNEGVGTGVFSSQLTGLQANTQYYVRAYAMNGAGVSYGNEIIFTTLQAVLPTINTTNSSNISYYSFWSGGNITNNGGASITAKGIVWSTSSNPTIILTSKTIEGNGEGIFTSNVINLQPNTTYYARAYATNTAGTAYGNEITLKTLSLTTPTITVSSWGAVTSRTIDYGTCNVTEDGGTAVSSRGICWNTSPNPTINNNKTTQGSGLGIFSGIINGLSPNTKYYVRAYATNSVGTSYGAEKVLTTPLEIGMTYQGGIIAYIFQSQDIGYDANVQHGIIAAPSDQSSNAQWGCDYTTLNIPETGIGAGKTNTSLILTRCAEPGIAARLCTSMTLGGYNDWVLPSKEELNKLYLNRTAIGGFANVWYFASNETGYFGDVRVLVSMINFGDGTISSGSKANNNVHIRAIRYF